MTADPIQLELFRNLFEAAAEEMGLTLQRVAFSANIKERRDFSCALFSPEGELLAQAAHIPVHLGSMPASLSAVLERLGELQPGDVAIVNDPYAGGTHLPDITVVTPIYTVKAEGEEIGGGDQGPRISDFRIRDLKLLGYSANRAHHADIGGATPGSMPLSRSILEEGFRIEPTLLYENGIRNEEFVARFLAAVRTPDERLGDLEAQLAANHVGAMAVARIAQRHGAEAMRTYSTALLDYAQRFMRATIAGIQAGVYAFEDVMDSEGSGFGVQDSEKANVVGNGMVGTQRPTIKAKVTITHAPVRAIVDFSESSSASGGNMNCPRAVTASAVYYCFACLLPAGVPMNAGYFRDVEIVTKRGSLLDAEYPAAVVAGNTETSQRVVDVVFGALAQALPERIPAASCGTMSSLAMGSGPRSGLSTQDSALRRWTYYETIGGGSGASLTARGESAVQCHMTNTLNTPAEALEMQYPLRVRRFERAMGTGGKGQNAGGDGIVREIEALADCEGTLLADRRESRPYGLAGGSAGEAGLDEIIRRQNGDRTAIASKAKFTLRRGDVIRIQTPGGGGWGLV